LGSEDLESLAARLKKLCGAGGAVKDGSIEIQGEHRDRLVAELHKLGYKAKRSGG
jgi:translation initiation factor 1